MQAHWVCVESERLQRRHCRPGDVLAAFRSYLLNVSALNAQVTVLYPAAYRGKLCDSDCNVTTAVV